LANPFCAVKTAKSGKYFHAFISFYNLAIYCSI